MKRFYVREIVAFLFVVFLLSAPVALCRCQPRTPEQAEAAYLAQQVACVERARTLAESRACRAEVDRRWGKPPFHGAP